MYLYTLGWRSSVLNASIRPDSKASHPSSILYSLFWWFAQQARAMREVHRSSPPQTSRQVDCCGDWARRGWDEWSPVAVSRDDCCEDLATGAGAGWWGFEAGSRDDCRRALALSENQRSPVHRVCLSAGFHRGTKLPVWNIDSTINDNKPIR